jgi:AcrR family transcriptional regulator
MDALVQATTELIVEKGLAISVREIAGRAQVNHGLVHAYFGSKDGLLSAAFDEINARAAAERDDDGFPPPDLAGRRGGELAKALARVMLDAPESPFSSHPITASWHDALVERHPEVDPDEADRRVMIASSLGLGWALFADHFSHVFALDEAGRAAMDASVAAMVADIGGIPT